MAKPSKNAKKTDTAEKPQKGRTQFQPGNPGGPGRPVGSRNRATVLLDQMADEEGQDILRKMIEAAKGGDVRSAEIVLSRIWPLRRGRPVSLALPSIDTAADVVKALGVVANAVGAGEITAEEGAAVASVLETKRRAIETAELEARVTALEKERSK